MIKNSVAIFYCSREEIVTVLVSKTFEKFTVSFRNQAVGTFSSLIFLLWRPSVHSFCFRDKLVCPFQWLYCLLTPVSSYTDLLIVNPSFRHFFCKLLIIVDLQSQKFL